MFAWPSLELTDYEKKFVRVYKDGKFPGVLRRTYQVRFNSVADALTPGLEAVVNSGQVQIARRARVFGLTFSGNLGSYRLQIETASGEQMTPKGNGADGYPVVSSMLAGGMWNGLSALGDQAVVQVPGIVGNGPGNLTTFFGNESNGALLIDPNWELSPNESLIFRGTAIEDQPTTEYVMTGDAQKLLFICVHVWEFPGMDNRGKRNGADIDVKG